jgi:hypothetical protein
VTGRTRRPSGGSSSGGSHTGGDGTSTSRPSTGGPGGNGVTTSTEALDTMAGRLDGTRTKVEGVGSMLRGVNVGPQSMGIVGGNFTGAAQSHLRTAEAKATQAAAAVDNAHRGTRATAQSYRDTEDANRAKLNQAGQGNNPPPKTNSPPSSTPPSANQGGGSGTSKPPSTSGGGKNPPGGGGNKPPTGGGGGGNNQGGNNNQGGGGNNKPPMPSNPPAASDIRHSDASRKHIIEGDGGRQGGHLAGTGFSKKTEFPKDWDEPKILDAAHQVTQQGPPSKGPYLTKDVDGKVQWAYDYTGVVDGVTVKTTVLADGEIRTAYPPNAADPGVISNPPAPNPAPQGVPVSNPPRYSHPDVGGDGSWTWEGPKGNREVRIVLDDQGNVTKTDLGPYKKK